MNRRGFLKFLASVPLIRHIPLAKRIYGDGTDGDLTLTENQILPHDKWASYTGGGGGAGGGGGIVIIITGSTALTVTANGGHGGNDLTASGSAGSSGSSSV